MKASPNRETEKRTIDKKYLPSKKGRDRDTERQRDRERNKYKETETESHIILDVECHTGQIHRQNRITKHRDKRTDRDEIDINEKV